MECTYNRVGDDYFDQISLSGHLTRISDLVLFAQLGKKAVRYRVLWERTAPESLASLEWDWSDRRLERLRQLGIRTIVGLLHHGSGPNSPTDLPDLVNALLDLFLDGEYGIWHLANQGEVSWAEFEKLEARQAGPNLSLLEECPSEEMDYLAPRPWYSAPTSQRGIQLPPLEEAVADYVRSTVFA